LIVANSRSYSKGFLFTAIGKIAGDQVLKLMVLGLTDEEAEEKIINGFLT